GKLHEEDAVARDGADRREVGLAREDMKAVKHDADRRVIGTAHGLPCVAIIVDMAAPGERLEADAKPALGGALPERMQVRSGTLDSAERLRADIGAHHQKVAAKLAHQIELAFGTRQSAFALRLRHALEVAE